MTINRAHQAAQAVLDHYLVLHPATRAVVNINRDLYVRTVLFGQALTLVSKNCCLVGAFGQAYLSDLRDALPEITEALSGSAKLILTPHMADRGTDLLNLGVYDDDMAALVASPDAYIRVSAFGTPDLFPTQFVLAAADYAVSHRSGMEFSPIAGISHDVIGEVTEWETLRQQAYDVLAGKRSF